MFIINQLVGTVLVHPDWDACFQMSVRYLTLGASVYITDIIDIVNQMDGLQ